MSDYRSSAVSGDRHYALSRLTMSGTRRTPRVPPRRPGGISDEARALFRRAEAAFDAHDTVKCNKHGCEACQRAYVPYRELHAALQLPVWAISPIDVHAARAPDWANESDWKAA